MLIFLMAGNPLRIDSFYWENETKSDNEIELSSVFKIHC